MDYFSVPQTQRRKIALHDLLHSIGCNFQERFIKDLWNSLWTTRNACGQSRISSTPYP